MADAEQSAKQGPEAEGSVYRRVRSWLYVVVEGGFHGTLAGRIFEAALILLILANVVAFAAETVPRLSEPYGPFFEWFDRFSLIVFTIEYLLRLWVSPDNPLYRKRDPWSARLDFARSPFMIIDALVLLPYYVGYLFAIDLRILRIFRLLRFLKLSRFSSALVTIGGVLQSEARALGGAFVVMVGIMIMAASFMYYAEGQVQPESFGTVPDAMWWAVATLTTVGYGDVVPITPLGKLIGAFVMILGLGFFALPVGIISNAFAQQIHRRDFVVNWGQVARIPLFARLDPTEIADIMDIANTRIVAAGTVLSYSGERGDGLYIVSHGQVEVRAPSGTLVLEKGDWFGEVALLQEVRRAATIVTTTRSHLIHVGTEDFQGLLGRNPGLKDRLNEAAAQRLRDDMSQHMPAEDGTS